MSFRNLTIALCATLTVLITDARAQVPQSFVSGEAGYRFNVPDGWQVAADPDGENAVLGIVNLLCGMREMSRGIPSGSAAIMISDTHGGPLDTPAKMLDGRQALHGESAPGFSRTLTDMGGRRRVDVLRFDAENRSASLEPITPTVVHVTDVAFMLEGQLVWVQLTDHDCPAAADALATVVGSLRRLP